MADLPWTSPQTLRDVTPEAPDFLVEGFWVRGAITDFPAKIKTGKTTFVSRMIKASLSGQPFMNQQTRIARFLYLTEERKETFRANLERAGLLDYDESYFKVLFRSDVLKYSWPEVMLWTVEEALRGGYTGLAVDTLSRWAKIEGEHQEQDSGIAAVAMAPLEAAAALGLAVVSMRHDNKGEGGDVQDSGRGSSAFGGASDIILNMRMAHQNGHPSRRLLMTASRFGDLPDRIFAELGPNGYEFVAEGEERDQAEALILPALQGGPMTVSELADLTGCARSTVQRAINDMLQHRIVVALPPVKRGSGRPRPLFALPATALPIQSQLYSF